MEDALRRELQSFVSSSPYIPGATLGVCLPDGTVVSVATGHSGMDRRIALTPSSRMLAGSVGKTFAAALILRSIANGDGGITTETVASEAVAPSVAAWLAKVPNASSATVGELLSHTAGIPDFGESPMFWKELKEHPDRRWEQSELLGLVSDTPAPFAHGKGYQYSDSNFHVIGLILEHIHGDCRYGALLKGTILDPLGLRDTATTDSRRMDGLACGSSQLGPPVSISGKVCDDSGTYAFDPSWDWAGGGIVSTASDLAKWTWKLYGTSEVVTAESAAAMSRPTEHSRGNAPNGGSYGLGTMVWESAEHGVALGHSGWMPGYNTVVAWWPKHRVSVALQVNYDRSCRRAPHDTVLRFLRVVLNQKPHST